MLGSECVLLLCKDVGGESSNDNEWRLYNRRAGQP